MHKRLLLVSSLALSTSLLLGGGISQAIAKGAVDDASLSPQSGWSVTRIGSETDGYCALSRQYEKNLVLTLGRNLEEEYSLAVDFQAAELNVDKAYSVTLQPGPGQIRAYEMMPASNQAMVVRLGYDKSFFQALESSELLKVEINGKDYDFEATDFTSGQTDLNNCWQALKGGGATKVASGFSAEKVKDAPPMKVTKLQSLELETPKIVAPKIEMPKVEAPKVATPKIEISKVGTTVSKVPEKAVEIKEPVKKVVKETVKAPVPIKEAVVKAKEEINTAKFPKPFSSRVSAAVPDVSPTKPVQVAMPKIEAPKVSKMESVMVQAPIMKDAVPVLERPQMKGTPEKVVELSKVESPKAAVKIEPKEVVKEIPVEAVKTSEKTPVKAIEISRVSSAISSAPYEAPKAVQKNIRSNNDALLKRSAVSKSVSKSKDAIKQTSIQKKQRDDLEQLKIENKRLNDALQTQVRTPVVEPKVVEKVAPKIVAKVEPKAPVVAAVTPKVVKELDKLKSENIQLAETLQKKEQKISALETQTPKTKEELAAARAEIDALEQENKLLYREAREARGQIDGAVVNAGNQALKKVREYENKYEAAKADNVTLLKEIEELRRMKEDNLLGAVAGNWDLEKSTKRYNEAEREIKRLGLLLEQQRVAHRQEKADLEQMLFDPAVTDREQRRRLNELEQQLEQAEKQLNNPSTSRATPRTTSRAPKEERVVVRTFPSLPSPPPAVVEQQRNNLEVQRLNNKIERQNQQLQAYARNKNSEKINVSSAAVRPVMPAVSATPVQRPVVSPSSHGSPSIAPVQRNALSFGEGQLKALLNKSGVSLTGGVIKQSAGRYRWSAGRLVGQAQIVPASSAGSLDGFAQSYIAAAKRGCGGDFASLPASVSGQKKAYEIACISPTRSTSSSVVFTQKGSELIAIAHESSADDMDAAMDTRDRVAGSL